MKDLKCYFAASLIPLNFLFLFTAHAASNDCSNVPTGEVDDLITRVLPGDYTQGPGTMAKMVIAPTSDCKNVILYTYIPSAGQKPKPPSNEECDAIHKKLPHFCGLYTFYFDEKSARDKPYPHAYMKEGILLTKTEIPGLKGEPSDDLGIALYIQSGAIVYRQAQLMKKGGIVSGGIGMGFMGGGMGYGIMSPGEGMKPSSKVNNSQSKKSLPSGESNSMGETKKPAASKPE